MKPTTAPALVVTPPPKPIEDPAELRAIERRAKEAAEKKKNAEAEADRVIAEEKEKAAEAKAAAELKPKIDTARKRIAETIAAGAKKAQSLRDQAKAIDEKIGNLEGAIITASETARHNPRLALGKLEAALASLESKS